MSLNRKKLILIVLAGFFLSTFSSTIIKAQNNINVPYGSTPTIDGFIDSGEWENSSVIMFTYTIVYVKHDGKSLYIAFNVEDSVIFFEDSVGFFIDVNHDGGSIPQMDDIFFGLYRRNIPFGGPYEIYNAGVPLPATDWSVMCQNILGGWTAEFKIPFSKVGITAGEAKTLGIRFESLNFGAGIFSWPTELSPSDWSDIYSEENWIGDLPSNGNQPKYPVAIIFVVIIIFAVFTLVFLKRKF